MIEETVSTDQLLHRVKKAYSELQPFEVHYGLRALRLTHITPATRDTVRWCIALQSLGIPITPPLLTHLSNRPYESTLAILHRLGDNNILTLIRDGKRSLIYILHPRTHRYLNPTQLAKRMEAST